MTTVYIFDGYSIGISTWESNTCWTRNPTRCMCLSLHPTYPCDIQLYQTAKGVSASYDALVELLESVEHFLNRLDIYTKVPPTPAMTEIVVKIMVELLSTLALATKQIQQGRPSEFILADVLLD